MLRYQVHGMGRRWTEPEAILWLTGGFCAREFTVAADENGRAWTGIVICRSEEISFGEGRNRENLM